MIKIDESREMTNSGDPLSVFDDLEHDLQGGSALTSDERAAAVNSAVKNTAEMTPELFTEPCKACGGSGIFRSWSGRAVGRCFKCKGAWKLSFKTSPAVRVNAKAKRVNKVLDKKSAFETAEPEVFAWLMKPSNFAFQVSLAEQFARKGDLTDGQLAAAKTCIARYNAKVEEARKAREEATKNAPVADASRIADMLNEAHAAGRATPKLRFAVNAAGDAPKMDDNNKVVEMSFTYIFSRAPDFGRNAGAIYVNNGDKVYMGKIVAGRFYKVRDCTAEDEVRILKIANDPNEVRAVAYGRLTGKCGCCGRKLTRKDSIERGIGPICAENYGW